MRSLAHSFASWPLLLKIGSLRMFPPDMKKKEYSVFNFIGRLESANHKEIERILTYSIGSRDAIFFFY